VKTEEVSGLQVLRGRVNQYQCARSQANFFFTSTDKNAMGVIAIGAALAGAGGAAVGTAMSASDLEEEADQVKFDLHGQPITLRLWLSGRPITMKRMQ
jgi:hypothetical protein